MNDSNLDEEKYRHVHGYDVDEDEAYKDECAREDLAEED
ncbi:hypothetical protein CPR19088_GLDEOEPO_01378 [Companilactobacillus paralimentarius]